MKIDIKAISKQLAKNGSMASIEVAKIVAKHGITALIKDENYLDIFSYNDALK